MAKLHIDIQGQAGVTEELTKEDISTLASCVDKVDDDSDVRGSVHVDMAYANDTMKVRERFPNLELDVDKEGIKFEDPEVERVLLASTDTNPNGDDIISLDEAKKATRLPSFASEGITTFDEVVYFENVKTCPSFSGNPSLCGTMDMVGVTTVNANSFNGTGNGLVVRFCNLNTLANMAFDSCRGITIESLGNVKQIADGRSGAAGTYGTFSRASGVSVNLSGITRIGDCAFYQSGNISVRNSDNVTYIGNDAFRNTSFRLKYIKFPSLETIYGATYSGTLYGYAFQYCNFKAILSLGKIKTILPGRAGTGGSYGMFAQNPSLRYVCLPDTLTSIGNSAFHGCSSLRYVTILAETPPTIGSNVLVGSVSRVFVRSNAVDLYKTNIASFASKIFAIGGTEWQDAATEAATLEGVDITGQDLSDENIFEYIYTHLPE